MNLDCLPNLQDLGKLMIGESVTEILESDLKLEQIALPSLQKGIAQCEKVGDDVTCHLFPEYLSSEEEHANFLETQCDMIERMEIDNYIQLQSRPAED